MHNHAASRPSAAPRRLFRSALRAECHRLEVLLLHEQPHQREQVRPHAETEVDPKGLQPRQP